MMHALPTTPCEDGFRMPAEWEPHAGCYLIWPERPDNWRLGGKPAQAAFARVAEAIAEAEPVTVLVSAAQYRNARERLPLHVRVVEMSTDDSWVRDSGPTFVVDDAGELRAVSWEFNAWGGLRGGLYFPWDADNLVGPKICDHRERDRIFSAGGILRFRESVTRERGSGEVDRGQYDQDLETGYVNGNGPITGWTALGGHGITVAPALAEACAPLVEEGPAAGLPEALRPFAPSRLMRP